MQACANCGHQLGVGRFCTNCGLRVDHATDADEATGASTRPPPPVEQPSQARYPLFADEPADVPAPAAPPTAPPPLPAAPPPPPASRPAPRRTRRSRGAWLPWAVGGAALLLFAMIGTLLLVTDDDSDPGSTARDQASEGTTEPTVPSESKPTRMPKPTEKPPTDEGPIDLARYAMAEVPETAPPNEDVSGNLVRYEAQNLLDGVPETCWRMPGSGAGDELVFTFQGPVVLTEVGLVNGYAKTSGDFDWYNGNRRILGVEWGFDDGTVVEQLFDETRKLQSLPIEAVTTTSVTLRLLEVSEPGRGRSARDYTAISDVSLVGEPA